MSELLRQEHTEPGDEMSGRLARRLDGLIGMLSHDLRTPLSAISGWLFLLESGRLDADAQKRALGKIKSSVDEQVQLIDDTLLISRGQIGHLEIELTATPILVPLHAAIESLRTQASTKSISIEIDTPDGVVTIDADSERLQRALDLLLAHALKVTQPGGYISIAVSVSPKSVEIRIRDSGSGFSEIELPRVLDPFGHSGQGDGRTRGAERGLLLAQALIAGHRGALRLSSPGQNLGETFTIELPRAGLDRRL